MDIARAEPRVGSRYLWYIVLTSLFKKSVHPPVRPASCSPAENDLCGKQWTVRNHRCGRAAAETGISSRKRRAGDIGFSDFIIIAQKWEKRKYTEDKREIWQNQEAKSDWYLISQDKRKACEMMIENHETEQKAAKGNDKFKSLSGNMKKYRFFPEKIIYSL